MRTTEGGGTCVPPRRRDENDLREGQAQDFLGLKGDIDPLKCKRHRRIHL